MRGGAVWLRAGALFLLLLPWLIRWLEWRMSYLFQVATLAGVWIIAALSQTVIAGFGGQLSVGQAGFMAIGAYTTGILTSRHDWPWWLGMLAGVLGAAAVAALIGVPTLRLRGPYFVMGTLAFGGIIHTVATNWLDLTGGPTGVPGVPAPRIGPLDFSRDMPMYYFVWTICLATIMAVYWFRETRLGRSLMAIREDELAAGAVGINTALVKSLGFIFSGAIAGLAGALMGHFIGYVSPDSFSVNQSVLILTLALIGGIERISGAIVGTVVIVLMTELLRDFSQYQLLAYGVVMLLVILFLPRGLVGEVTEWWQRRTTASPVR